MFEELGVIVNAVILAISLVALFRTSELTITYSLDVASVTSLGKTTVGFILVAFSTSLPELFVAIFSIMNPENIGVSIGNILGSNIVNICLIIGACFLLVALKSPLKGRLLPSQVKEGIGSLYFGLFIASMVPLALLYIGYASRIIGILLLAIFVYYMFQLSKVRNPLKEEVAGTEKKKLGRYLLLTILGAVGVVVSSFFIVESASNIAAAVGVPPVIIGATVVAFGTSVPELATSFDAVKKGHLDLALGNIVGSCFLNITCILGVTLVASPLRINMEAFSHLALFSLITNLMFWYFLSTERIGWREGAVLLVMYFAFIVINVSGYTF